MEIEEKEDLKEENSHQNWWGQVTYTKRRRTEKQKEREKYFETIEN